MSYKTALQLKGINEKNGESFLLLAFNWHRNQPKIKCRNLRKSCFLWKQIVSFERKEGYLKGADTYYVVVEKYDKKIFVSKSGKTEYAEAVSKRDQYRDLMEKEGVSGKDEWTKQTQIFEKLEARVPFIQSQV